jgi:hypothetical protein
MPWTALVICLVSIQSKGPSFEPSASYEVQTVEGFTVKLSKAARQNKADLGPAMALLRLRLSEIARRVPAEALTTLRKVPIWVQDTDPLCPCMTYHNDPGWLKEHGMNPDMAKGVELASLKNFVLWSIDQPMMVLHEYAHSYHDARFGFEGKLVLDAYKNAMDHHLYDEDLYYRGQKKKGYASTNQMEYFAELSEALFGYNDFFPFTRPELAEYDPTGYQMVKTAWGLKD